MMRYFYLILFIIISPVLAYSQSGYYVTDSVISYGVKLIDGGDLLNSQLCQIKGNGKVLQFTPFEINEYGFKDGRIYVSKEISLADSSKRVFLERVHDGEIDLYFYRGKKIKTFYAQKDSSLIFEIPKNTNNGNYSDQLLRITADCSNVSEVSELVSYNKKSLGKFFSMYDHCERKPFPYFRSGFMLGYEYVKIIPSSQKTLDINLFNFGYDGGGSIGFFIDCPIQVSNFSLHAEILFSQHSYSYNTLVNDRDLDFLANFTSLSVPVLVRYSYPSNSLRPFINIGLNESYYLKNETHLFKTVITGNVIEINNSEMMSMMDDFQLGFVIGTGVEYKISYKRSLFFEVRYTKSYNKNNENIRGISGYNILTGVNF